MKVSAIQSNYTTNLYSAQREKINNIQKNQYAQKQPQATISFGGKNANHVVFIGAELPPYCKVGGVGTVMNDYTSFNCENKAMVIPYYNGKIEYDQNGKPTEKVSVHRFPENHELAGQPFYTKADLSKKTLEEVLKSKEYVVLEEVGNAQNMTWGKKDKNEIQLFHVKGTGIADKNGVVKPDAYMIFTDVTARMTKPYADDSYSSNFGCETYGSWEGSPYAKFDKAFVKLMPLIEKNQKDFDPGTVICSDSQTAYVPLYMSKEQANDNQYYQTMKSSFVGHNLGSGYCGETSNESMLVNSGLTADEINTITNDKEYVDSIKKGKGQTEEYLKQFLDTRIFDTTGRPNPILIPLNLLDQDLLSAVTTVSEGYSEDLKDSPIGKKWSELKDKNKVGGILNPLNAKDITGFKPMSNKWLNTTFDNIKLKDGSTASIKPFVFYDETKIKAGDLDHLKEIKTQNKINLIERLNLYNQIAEGEYQSPDNKTISARELENGLMSGNTKTVGIYGKIDDTYLNKLKNGEDVTLFVTWGRGDFQKGLDTTMQAFETYVTKYNDENAILLLGGEIPASGEEKTRIEAQIKKATNGTLKGRVVYMDGFVPANGFASAADAAVFPSRFAPCELTDLESKKFFATPIVTNCQGLAQKNFDRSFEGEENKVDAFKTKHQFNMTEEEIQNCGIKEIEDKYNSKKATFVENEKKTILCHNSFSEEQVSDKDIDKIALENAKSKSEYQKFERDTKDEIIQYELADKFNEFVVAKNNDKDLMKKILINQANLDTTWAGNAALHPSGKNTEQLYKEQHIDPKVKTAKEVGAGLFTVLATGATEKVAQMKEAQKVMVTSNVENAVKKGNRKIGGYIALATTLIAGTIGTGIYFKNKKQKQENAIEGQTFVING